MGTNFFKSVIDVLQNCDNGWQPWGRDWEVAMSGHRPPAILSLHVACNRWQPEGEGGAESEWLYRITGF